MRPGWMVRKLEDSKFLFKPVYFSDYLTIKSALALLNSNKLVLDRCFYLFCVFKFILSNNASTYLSST